MFYVAQNVCDSLIRNIVNMLNSRCNTKDRKISTFFLERVQLYFTQVQLGRLLVKLQYVIPPHCP